MIGAFGLRPPAPKEPAFSAEEARVFVELGRLDDIWPPEFDVRLGRAWGPLLARAAQAAMQPFRHYAEPRLRTDHTDRLAGLRAVQSAFERLLPLADPVLLGVYHRWVEHELAQAAVSEAEASSHALPGAVSVAFLFCDLKDFTAFADAEGDEAAIAAVDRFFETVALERGDDARLMKSLGDGVMLAYGEAPTAVSAGARIMARARTLTPLSVHASVHCGVAIVRDGDYSPSTWRLACSTLRVPTSHATRRGEHGRLLRLGADRCSQDAWCCPARRGLPPPIAGSTSGVTATGATVYATPRRGRFSVAGSGSPASGPR